MADTIATTITTTPLTADTLWYSVPQQVAPGVCPHCGYCPHCGRGGRQAQPYDPQPWYPQPTYPSWYVYMTSGVSPGSLNINICR